MSADEVRIKAWDPHWPRLFEAEKADLIAVLGEHFVAIEHIGSTAVPGLAAKPVIDILAGVRSMQAANDLIGPLCRVGWDTSAEFNATLDDSRFLLRWPNGVRTFHLHLVVYGGEQWQLPLAVRDLLRVDGELAREYETLKFELAEKHRDDREAYTDAKTEFIARALKNVHL
jgi:GrpB-like predicted nucleotidyltransferase (UPF0157 family)